jgi:hypothetical protein
MSVIRCSLATMFRRLMSHSTGACHSSARVANVHSCINSISRPNMTVQLRPYVSLRNSQCNAMHSVCYQSVKSTHKTLTSYNTTCLSSGSVYIGKHVRIRLSNSQPIEIPRRLRSDCASTNTDQPSQFKVVLAHVLGADNFFQLFYL